MCVGGSADRPRTTTAQGRWTQGEAQHEGLGQGGPRWRRCPEVAMRAKASVLPRCARESLGTESVSAACLSGQKAGRARSPSGQNTGKKIISKK